MTFRLFSKLHEEVFCYDIVKYNDMLFREVSSYRMLLLLNNKEW